MDRTTHRHAGLIDLEQLVTTLKAEEADAASFHTSEIAKAGQLALDRFFARPYGDEAENRSKAVSHDIEDTINWIMPELMRTFRGGEGLVSVKTNRIGDDKPMQGGRSPLDIMSAYLEYIFFDDNPGLTNVYDFAFDGLLMRMGVLSVSWDEDEEGPTETEEGVGPERLAELQADQFRDIMAVDEVDESWTVEHRRKKGDGKCYVEAVPTEEFAIDRLAKSVKTSRYHRRKRKVYLADLKRQFPDSRQALDDFISKEDDDLTNDPRAVARNPDNLNSGTYATDKGREEVDLFEEYIRVDFDGDGYVELRRIKRVGDVILENERVERSEFVTWTPNRISHRVAGRSMADILDDLQRIKTVITRRYLDGLGQTITPRTYVNVSAVDGDAGTLQALQANDIGGVIPVNGNPRDAIHETVTPDISAPALSALEYFEAKVSESSGVTKQSQGMDPQAMNKTASGIDLLQAAAKTRIEMIATWLGLALEDAFRLIIHAVTEYQSQSRIVELFGQPVTIDPGMFPDECSVSIHVGSAGVSKQQRIQNLMLIAQKQEQVLMTAGPANPLVTLQHLRGTYSKLVSAMGFKDSTEFWGEIPEGWQPPAPGPDPKTIEVQQKTQLQSMQAEHQAKLNEAKLQSDAQMQAAKISSEKDLAMIKAQSEADIARIRLAGEQQLARERMAMERELAMMKMAQEREVALHKVNTDKDVKMNGFREGGSLAQ